MVFCVGEGVFCLVGCKSFAISKVKSDYTYFISARAVCTVHTHHAGQLLRTAQTIACCTNSQTSLAVPRPPFFPWFRCVHHIKWCSTLNSRCSDQNPPELLNISPNSLYFYLQIWNCVFKMHFIILTSSLLRKLPRLQGKTTNNTKDTKTTKKTKQREKVHIHTM